MKNDSVFLVAGGTSLEGFDFSKLKNKDVIAVNKSILDLPFAKYFVTMDYTFIDKKLKGNRGKFIHSKATRVFIANLCPAYMREEQGRIVDTRNNYVYRLNAFDMIIKSRFSSGIGWGFNQFVHGSNSGFCAFQLAVCLGYKNIHLLGYDLSASGKTHYHDGYHQDIIKFNERLHAYASNFDSALKRLKFRKRDTKIYSYSPTSPINSLTIVKSLEQIDE